MRALVVLGLTLLTTPALAGDDFLWARLQETPASQMSVMQLYQSTENDRLPSENSALRTQIQIEPYQVTKDRLQAVDDTFFYSTPRR